MTENSYLLVNDILKNVYKKHILFNLLNGVPITIGENFYVTTVQWTDPLSGSLEGDPNVYKESLFMAAS